MRETIHRALQRNLNNRAVDFAKKRLKYVGALISATVVFGMTFFVIFKSAPSMPLCADTSNSCTPPSLGELLRLTSSEVAPIDIAQLNLLCAEGLQGLDACDVQRLLKRLDEIADRVRSETERHYYRFRKAPEEFEHSEGFFRMLLMAVVLQEDFGIVYNPDRITAVGKFEPNERFFANARDVFIHGLIGAERRGTCASLPVLYVAVGRRLGYPLKLVPAKNHLFVRWEDSVERFNVDAAGRGISRFDDDHYRHWPFVITPEEEQEFGYLKSMTPAQELATFLSLRGHCLLAAGRLEEAVAAHEAALHFSPNSRLQQMILAAVREQTRAVQGAQSMTRTHLREPFPRTRSQSISQATRRNL